MNQRSGSERWGAHVESMLHNDQIVELLVTPKDHTVSTMNVHAVLRGVHQMRWRDSCYVRGGGFSKDSPFGLLGLPPLLLLWLTCTG
jgi:hypothetical protein